MYINYNLLSLRTLANSLSESLKYIAPAFLIAASCHVVSKNAAKIAILLHRVQNQQDKRIRNIVSMKLYKWIMVIKSWSVYIWTNVILIKYFSLQIQIWSLHMQHRKVKFMAAGLFNLDATFIYKVIMC